MKKSLTELEQGRLLIENKSVPYFLIKRNVRHLRIEFTNGDMLVIAPQTLTNEQSVLLKHKAWILKRISAIERAKSKMSGRFTIKALTILGRRYKIKQSNKFSVNTNDLVISVNLLNEAHKKRLYGLVKTELMSSISAICTEYYAKLKVKPKRIYIKNQKMKWGSCSAKKGISFNVKIAFLPERFRRYIVFHELLHLKIKEHNEEFFKRIGEEFSDYQEIESNLFNYWFALNNKHGPLSAFYTL